MRRCRLFIPVFLLLLAAQLALGQNKILARRIEKILADADLSRATWGIDVVSLTSGHTLYARNADKLFTPASNTKLFTTAAALALIGPEYRFQTTVETSAALDGNGRLAGDLVLVGRGDPNLSGRVLPYQLRTQRDEDAVRALEDLADQLVRKGLKSVGGDLVADDSYYAFERYGEGWAQDDLITEWGAPASALTINDNVLYLSLKPGERPGDPALVSLNPAADYYQIENRVLTTAPGSSPRKIHFNREPGSLRLTLWGNIPANDSGSGLALAIEDPADYAARILRSLLEKRSVIINGHIRTRHRELADLPTNAAPAVQRDSAPVVLASYQSPPLGEDLTVINKVSQNLHAELLLRLLGHEKGAAGNVASGREVLRGFLIRAGLPPEEFDFHDGSGLSRKNLVTPEAVVKLLSYASRQPWGAFYESTLPVGGVDGSLAERFKLGAGREHVHGKTGSIAHINALSGYATTRKGDRIAFSVLVNNHNLPNQRALETIDRIVEAMLAEK